MINRTKYASGAWAMVALLVLAGCGSPATTESGASATAANVTFKTDPPAAVWIDGTQKGTTPVVVAVDAGSHEISFKADGFETATGKVDVVAGKDITVETALAVASGDEDAALSTLTAALGIEREAFGEITVHRGAGDSSVMLYWPQENVRREGLSTYRVEVTADYEGDGFIEFRNGKEVLHREPFEPEGYITEKALPASVLESIKRGRSIEWGVYYEGSRKKNTTASFKVVDGSALDRKLAKIQNRQVYQRAKPVDREMAKIELLRNYRFYSEALTASMSVLNTWPETQLPFKAIAASLERLKLKETTLYTEVASRLRGSKSRFASNGGGLGGVQGPSLPGPLPPSLVAPKVRDQGSSGGMKAGGMGVTPTPDAQKRLPGAIDPTASGGAAQPGGVAVGREPGADLARKARLEALEEELRQLEDQGGNIGDLEQAVNQVSKELDDARSAVESAGQAVAAAEAALEAAKAANDLPAQQLAQQQFEAAKAAEAKANEQFLDSERRKMDAEKELVEALTRSDENRQKMDELKGKIDEAKKPLPHEQGPGQDPTRVDPLNPGGNSAAGFQPSLSELQQAMTKAQSDLESAQQYAQQAVGSVDTAKAGATSAQSALEAAEANTGAVDAAIAAVEAAKAANDPAAIQAASTAAEQAQAAYNVQVEQARQAAEAAQNELARAQMDVERANAAQMAAQEQLAETNQALADAAKAKADAAGALPK